MVRTSFSSLAVLFALAGAAAGADKKAGPVDAGRAQAGLSGEVNGLSVGLAVDRSTFGLLGRMTVIPRGQRGRPEPIHEAFKLKLVLRNTGGQPLAVFRDANAAGAAGAVIAEVTGPDGGAVEPLNWADGEPAHKPAAAGLTLKAGEEHSFDLTAAFFHDANSDPNEPPPSAMAATALGNKRYCLLQAGTYRIRATYKPGAGAPAGAWAGEGVEPDKTLARVDSAAELVAAVAGGVPGKELWQYVAVVLLALLLAEIALTRHIAAGRTAGQAGPVPFGQQAGDAPAFRRRRSMVNAK